MKHKKAIKQLCDEGVKDGNYSIKYNEWQQTQFVNIWNRKMKRNFLSYPNK